MTDFSTLYQKYAQDVFRFAYFLSGNQADAEDITSEAFVRAWNAPGEIRQSTVKAYLLTIARNCYLQDLRHKRRHAPLEQDVSDPRQATHQSVEQRDELACVMRDLRQLSEVDRAALLLSAIKDFSYEQIAGMLGLSLGAVKTKIHRARLKLVLAREQRR